MEDPGTVQQVVLPLALAAIMISLGLSLTPADFRRVLVAPKGVFIGLANLLVLSPFLAFGVAMLFGLEAGFAVGLVLLGAAPGGTMANLLTHLARGEVALSVTMTAVSSLLAVITVPVYLALAIDHFDADVGDDVEMLGVVLRVFLITIVPLAIGMWLRSRDPERVIAAEPQVKRFTLGVFFCVVVAAVASEFDRVIDHVAELAGAALALNVIAMALSFAIARAARLNDRQATAIALELGLHNSTLAITVAASVSSVLTIPAAVYSVFMFATAGAFARVMSRRNADPAA